MEWNKYTIKTTTIAEDMVSGMLIGLGISGIEIEDSLPISEEDKKAMFIDILPELPIDEGIAYISFYLEEGEAEKEILLNVKKGLEDLREYIEIGEGQIITTVTREDDYINKWKEFFKPFEVDGFIIKPTWESIDPNNIVDIAKNDKTDRVLEEEWKDKYVVEIDPGTAFGTGRHETTRLCIGQLREHLQGKERVLDAGCGSGILSIVARLLGAGFVAGTDIDPIAVDAARKNLMLNGIAEDSFAMELGNLIDDSELRKKVGAKSFDLVVANILADVIIPLAPVVPELLKKDGVFISSGIINTKEDAVKKAILDAGMKIENVIHLNDWVCIVARG